MDTPATACPSCEGRGYHTWSSIIWDNCEKCSGKGYITVERKPCPICVGGTAPGSAHCPKCKGKGEVIHLLPYKRECPNCSLRKGSGLTKALGELDQVDYHTAKNAVLRGLRGKLPKSALVHHKCDMCRGVGEVKLFNPVLKRALFHKSRY